jgi:adenine phosphoribosyltransferase
MRDASGAVGARVESLVEIETPPFGAATPVCHFLAHVGTQQIELPVLRVDAALAVPLLLTLDVEIEFIEQAGAELADAMRAANVEAVVTAATLGIPVGAAVARALKLPRQYVLQKSQKYHLADALSEPVGLEACAHPQFLRLDRRWASALAGKRVAFVDDVLSSGSSCAAALRLLRRAGANVVAVGAFLAQGEGWRLPLGPADTALVTVLGRVPFFRADETGANWKADWAP